MRQTINKENLVKFLENFSSHEFVSLETRTAPSFIKTGRVSSLSFEQAIGSKPENVFKFSDFVSGLGYEYAKMIGNRLTKEGKGIDEYVLGDTWHEAVEGTKTIRRNKKSGELYVYVFLCANNVPKSKYYDVVSGNEIDKEKLSEFLPKEYAPKNQGLTEGSEVLVRTFKLDSIERIRSGGNEYVIIK